jgi:hypothetical protein
VGGSGGSTMRWTRFRRRLDTRFRGDRHGGFFVVIIVFIGTIIIVILVTCHIFGTPGGRIGTG